MTESPLSAAEARRVLVAISTFYVTVGLALPFAMAYAPLLLVACVGLGGVAWVVAFRTASVAATRGTHESPWSLLFRPEPYAHVWDLKALARRGGWPTSAARAVSFVPVVGMLSFLILWQKGSLG